MTIPLILEQQRKRETSWTSLLRSKTTATTTPTNKLPSNVAAAAGVASCKNKHLRTHGKRTLLLNYVHIYMHAHKSLVKTDIRKQRKHIHSATHICTNTRKQSMSFMRPSLVAASRVARYKSPKMHAMLTLMLKDTENMNIVNKDNAHNAHT